MTTISRRNILIAAGLFSTGLTPVFASTQVWSEMPKKWDEDYDVIVVGSGFAGLAAAAEAKDTAPVR